MAESVRIISGVDDDDIRIDKFVAEFLNSYSRSYIKSIIKDGLLKVNGSVVKPSYIVKENDEIIIDEIKDKILDIEPENIDIDILYEDSDILVVNKGKGMVVHPANGHYCGTLVNAILYHCNDLSNINGILRPGIVHRIDKNTTGAIVICKNNYSHNYISEQLKQHSIKRRYIAIVRGSINEAKGEIDLPVGRDANNRLRMAVNYKNGKNAVTTYKVLKELNGASLIEFRLKTGRTHQIRVHMSHLGHPLLGDSLYGETKYTAFTNEQCLHAELLGFMHPSTEEYIEFNAPIPEYMDKLYNRLGGIGKINDLLENETGI